MPKSKIQKQEIFRTLQEKIKKSKSMVFAGFNSFGVKDNEELRVKLKAEGSEYYVAKKTLLNLAFKENKIDINVRDFPGKVAAIFSYDDEIAPAKVLGTFRQDKTDKDRGEKIFFLGGILEGKFLSKIEVEALSKLPSKQELYAKLVGSLNAPISGFVNVLAGNLRGLVSVLKAISEKK